ncbi:hypothetical protein EJH19_10470 [Salmonella enterica subsp. enterica serovar Vitkin]|nr:hypothetical protein [Salmonella enterica]EBS1712103.1 hypothetical protein [Salmonella enterica subsp. enterica serovar Vitkin]EBY2713807.1 hypothetical protein [Salmonella enterica subsp. enterica serovar Kentucky]EBZ8777649.1 hypothetical protein [Salmonella enterica subsp. enterica serovar Anatum]ECG3180832.1 hypothetical protein [Salmonella enterica subsp. enterica serovar Kottbus]ECS8105307.1 hypothetical protein [Salmonella enterica subsp. enterica serovar Montevideo]
MTDTNTSRSPSSGINFISGEWLNQMQRDLVLMLADASGDRKRCPCCGACLSESKPTSGNE